MELFFKDMLIHMTIWKCYLKRLEIAGIFLEGNVKTFSLSIRPYY